MKCVLLTVLKGIARYNNQAKPKNGVNGSTETICRDSITMLSDTTEALTEIAERAKSDGRWSD